MVCDHGRGEADGLVGVGVGDGSGEVGAGEGFGCAGRFGGGGVGAVGGGEEEEEEGGREEEVEGVGREGGVGDRRGFWKSWRYPFGGILCRTRLALVGCAVTVFTQAGQVQMAGLWKIRSPDRTEVDTLSFNVPS